MSDIRAISSWTGPLHSAHFSAFAIRPFVPPVGPAISPTANPAQTALMEEAHAPLYAPSIETTAVSPLPVFQPISPSEELGRLTHVAVNVSETVSSTVAHNEFVTTSDDECLLEILLDKNTANGSAFEHAAQRGASETQDASLHDERLIDTANDDVSTNATQSHLRRRRNRGYNNNTDGGDNDDDVLIGKSRSSYFLSSPFQDTSQPVWPTQRVRRFGSFPGRGSFPEPRFGLSPRVGSSPGFGSLEGTRLLEELEFSGYCLLPEPERARAPTFVERLLALFTVYDQLMTASVESDYSTIFEQLKYEWSLSVASLLAITAVDVGIFSIGDGTIFGVIFDSITETALSVSSTTSVIGTLCGAWYISRYDARNIKDRAVDVFRTYLFFSVSCRVPGLWLLVSTSSVLVFLCIVAYNRSPRAVLACAGIFGALMTLQYFWYATRHVLVKGKDALASVTRGT
ncbi:hypothetical protein FISHEDRAFT_79052 [Fistulina hepatica ATCC 64428]|uniref:Transmembrane protein n=1 Tax=Fistulina hepatica ATCC 64428 TaxID=1128425 RepID=A0A0D6ZZI3_9AGAR|nr:hypothetical protein FISHEDRAFT_79052 [Fistulina hepatica ATCC 64428]